MSYTPLRRDIDIDSEFSSRSSSRSGANSAPTSCNLVVGLGLAIWATIIITRPEVIGEASKGDSTSCKSATIFQLMKAMAILQYCIVAAGIIGCCLMIAECIGAAVLNCSFFNISGCLAGVAGLLMVCGYAGVAIASGVYLWGANCATVAPTLFSMAQPYLIAVYCLAGLSIVVLLCVGCVACCATMAGLLVVAAAK